MPKKAAKEKKTMESCEEVGKELAEGEPCSPEQPHADVSANAEQVINMENPSTKDLMLAITSFKQDFNTKIDGVLTEIRIVQTDVKDCSGRIMEAEMRISTAEDQIQTLKETIEKLENKTKNLNNKVEDLEGRSRRNNLRVLGIPEKVEGNDTCSFMEKWIADTLKITPPVLERAHRTTASQSSTTYPRTIIIKCLNYKDRENILKAARIQKEVMYQNNKIRFLPDLPTEVYKRQRSYDGVRKRLRELGLDKHRVIYPARLLLTNDDRTVVFNTPTDVNKYIKELETVTEED
ncbi:hypothetical protein QQF64_024936 [Cirrhinus molitorella]|uniref:L1 transposable element RRM domain-containing protein n=1 Tax=Cirrhinus molitorella TaxID=172907 RepID=A0ABR3NMQ2_9TELE